MSQSLNNVLELQKYIDVNTPIIYINDFDFARVDEIIEGVVGRSKIVEWNHATGCTDFRTRRSVGYGVKTDLISFLREIYTLEIDDDFPVEEKFIVLRDIQDEIEKPEVKTLLALIAQRELYDRRFSVIVIIVSSVNHVPEEIAPYVTFLEISRPDEQQINSLINEHIETNDYHNFKESDRDLLMPSLKGLTAYEIDRILDMAMSNNGTLTASDKDMILKQKKMMVRKSGLLELVDSNVPIEHIGGLDDLKDYLKKKADIFQNLAKALKFGVTIPKGVFLVGMPGCGKSLCAKAAASTFGVPLLKLDMGSMMGKYVGQSEENLRKA
ncbi:MAG: AAA family ATPase, partial [Bacteroidales bacterium]|nr:AAA family ATPase [Bacteroidales bacterium]